MREILFRGKDIQSGKWVEGFFQIRPMLVVIGDYSPWYIVVPPVDPDDYFHLWNVDEKSVGEFTGVTDKNGKKIFEGDIVRIFSSDYVGFNELGKVEFKNGCFGASYFPEWERKYSFGKWHFHIFGQVDKWQDYPASGEMKYTYEVVGNIHDNPEMLKD